MVEVCFSSPQRVNWTVERDVRLAVFVGGVAVFAGDMSVSVGKMALSVSAGAAAVSAGGIATALAGTATTRTGEALPPLRFRQISSSSDLRGSLADFTTATSKPVGTGCVKSVSFP